MNNSKLKEFAKEKLTRNGIALMENREKGDMCDLVNTKATIIDFDFLKDENNKEYVVFITKEDDKNFYCGGMVLTELCTSIQEENLKEDLQKDGLEVKFIMKRSKKSNKNYVAVEIVE